MKANISYNFEVIHAVNFELFGKKSGAASSYGVQFEQLESKNFKIEVRRNDFKINNKKVESKFERVAYEYNKAIFPVLFDVKDGAFLLSNYTEIAERIAAKDEELSLKHEGPGFQYIRNQFLENAAKDGYAMSRYFFSFGLMKVIMLCLQEAENDGQYDFHWDIIPLETTLFWEGNIKFDPALKTLNYEGQNTDTDTLFEKIKEYGIANKYPQKLSDEDSLITTKVSNEIQFVNSKLDFDFSKTEIKINNPYFDYQETLSIDRKY
ncbi:MAG: hypothetical protein ABI793_00320 [Flavobacterium sp.]